jgi:hypothetical protein
VSMVRTGTTPLAFAIALALGAAACGPDSQTTTGPSTSGPVMFTAQLSAANEVPPVSNAESGARGSAIVTLNVPRDADGTPIGAGTVSFSVQLNSFPRGTPVVAGHIHVGPAGSNGGVVVDTGLSAATALLLSDGTANITFVDRPVAAAVAAAIYANPAGYYVNFHSPLNPGGVVRGQLARQ